MNSDRIAALIFGLCVLVSTALGLPVAEAQDEDGSPITPPRWSGNIRQFATRDFPVWRAGRWIQDVHDGRGGWWWVVAGTWYPYDQVSYPYPDPYTPASYQQPRTIEPNPAANTVEPQPPLNWFYCESSGQFYPYAVYCADGWTAVPLGVRPQPRTSTRTNPPRPPAVLKWTTAKRDH